LATDSYPLSTPQLSADGRFLGYESGTNILIWDVVFQTNIIVNLDSSNTRPASGISHTPILAPDGRSIAFVSNAGDLIEGVSGGDFQVFWRDVFERFTFLASVNTNDGPANANHEFVTPAMSADGFTIAFESSAADLIPDDLNHAMDVFAYDFLSELQLVCASTSEPTRPATTGPGEMSISRNCASANGQVIAFYGYDSSLAREDTNLLTDVFVHDLVTGTNRMLGLDTNAFVEPAGGTGGPPIVFRNTNSLFDPEISADGRYVAYTRRIQSTSLIYHDDIYRFDLVTGSRRLVNRSSSGGASTGSASLHSMSSDGRFVAFESNGTDLAPNDPNQDSDIYIRDLALNTNILITFNVPGNSTAPRFAPDDQHLFFLTQTELLMAVVGQTNTALVVSHAPQSSTTPLPPVKSFNVSGNSQRVVFNVADFLAPMLYRNDLASNSVSLICSNCQNGVLNGDGRWVVYESRDPATTLRSVYLQDIDNGTNQLVSSAERLNVPSDAPLDSFSPVISRDARFIVFLSRVRTPLAPTRLYVYDRSVDQLILLTPGQDSIGLVSGSGAQLQFARDGRTLVFRSFSDLVEGDYNDKRDVFVVRLGGGDSDGDGMDDDWEMAYFQTLARNGSGDFDNDAQTDLEEFRAGTDPTNQGSIFHALTVTRVGGATTVFWNGSPGIIYRVEFKATLTDSDWSAVVGEVRFNGSTAYMVDGSHASTAQGFYRVVALP
jgi:Tol biopolymer transport system component